MRATRLAFFTLLVLTMVIALALTIRSSHQIWGTVVADAKPVPAGDWEIAWLAPAASNQAWERIVDAAEHLNRTGIGDLRVQFDMSQAYIQATAGVPEIAMHVEGVNHRLLLRWYKVSDERPYRTWIQRFVDRGRLPLAIVGGETTSRAIDLSHELEKFRIDSGWGDEAPTLLLTTATADAVAPPGSEEGVLAGDGSQRLVELMQLYRGPAYRFSFSNKVMARAVLDFLTAEPSIWPDRDYSVQGVASAAGSLGPLSAVTTLNADQHRYIYAMYAINWSDNEYSLDLRDRFLHLFRTKYRPRLQKGWSDSNATLFRIVADTVTPRISNPLKPRPHDLQAAVRYLMSTDRSPRIRQVLALPANAERAGGVLRAIQARSEKPIDNLVVVSGDSLSINSLYRDRLLLWHVAEIPYPVVCFSHRNPADDEVGFRPHPTRDVPWADTGTQDLLFYRDLLEAVLLAAFGEDTDGPRHAGEFGAAMGNLCWHGHHVHRAGQGTLLFEGRNRREGTGEHIVLLQPKTDPRTGAATTADLTVWARIATGARPQWRCVRTIKNISYH